MTEQPGSVTTTSYPAYVQDDAIALSANSLEVLRRRYLRKGLDGEPVETPAQMFYRVASHLGAVEPEFGGDEAGATQKFYELLTSLRFFPNSPTFTGAGTPLGQLAACFVLPIEDDMGKHPDGIFQTMRNAALIQQTGGGNGFSFSRLRPRGDKVMTSAGIATGPVGFLEAYDKAFGVIAQGGTRRGANMAVLRVDHPDVEEFVSSKADEGRIANFNISVGVTDAFMAAVMADESFDLVNPRSGELWRSVKARALFDEIAHYAHRNGEPGMLFLDAANRTNPVPQLYELEATNPCVTGETLIYTANGLQRAQDLAARNQTVDVAIDGRFGGEPLQSASSVFPTGVKEVFRLMTKEGYSLRLTRDHRLMTARGWVEAGQLQPGDRIHLLNRPGGFGQEGTRELGLVLGWLVGDGTINQVRAVLSFFGEEKEELAPLFADAVTELVDVGSRSYPVGLTTIEKRSETRIQSDRLRVLAAEYGLDEEKLQVPDVILRGAEATQQAFLQALFTADGTVNDGGNKGCSVRLTSVSNDLLQDVQRLLLNFGIASRIYRERRPAGFRRLPDGRGGRQEYWCQAYHELAIAKDNLFRFADRIGFLSAGKQSALLAYLERMVRGPYRETFTARFVSLEPDGRDMVYDLEQASTHSFIANGLVVHNCGEQWLGPYENCCLGSINLARHLDDQGTIDWELLEESVAAATHFLDNVVQANAYVPAVPQLKEAAHRVRRIGLGIMGLADVMYTLGVRYGSDEAEELAAQIMEFVRYHCMRSSIELARQRGAFTALRGSIYDSANLQWEPPTPLQPYNHEFGRPALNWDVIVAGIMAHGIRNGAQTTIAPTGTIGTVTGCEGYGCEPVFALAYTRYVKEASGDVALTYVSPLFLRALEDAGIEGEQRQRVIDEILHTGTCQNIEELPEAILHTFVVSQDVTPGEHVRMQAALQRFVDNSISKTCNFPPEATVEDVKAAYEMAWKLGCKGLTVYVTGSRQEVVLETKATAESKIKQNGSSQAAHEAEHAVTSVVPSRRRRPAHLNGVTYRRPTPLGTAYITVNSTEDDEPFEVFLNVGKAGSDVAAVSEALGRLMSYILRMPSPLEPSERLQQIVYQLGGIGGGRPLGFGPQRVRSLPDALAQVLSEYLSEVEMQALTKSAPVPAEQMELPLSQIGDLCPECGQATFLYIEGCKKCINCSYSEC